MDLGELVAAGRTSEVYAFGTDSVAKMLRPGVPRDWLRFEAELTAAVRAAGVPAPLVRDLIEIDTRTALVLEYIDGPSMWELMVDQPLEAAALAQQLASIHRDLMAVGVPSGLPDMVDRTCRKIADADQLADLERAEAVALADSLPRGAALLHGDLHPGNILMSAAGPVVIDWFDAAIGHPVADVVRSSILMRPSTSPAEHAHLPDANPRLLARLHGTYTGAMADLLGPAQDHLASWEAVVAVGRLAEAAHVDESSLIRLWEARHDSQSTSALRPTIDLRGDELVE